jgi:hypothetical protein
MIFVKFEKVKLIGLLCRTASILRRKADLDRKSDLRGLDDKPAAMVGKPDYVKLGRLVTGTLFTSQVNELA